METKTSGGETTVFLTEKEFIAFSLISDAKGLNIPYKELAKNFKDEKITPRERSAGIRAYNMSKRGAYITKNTGYGSGYVDRTHYWGSPNEFSGSGEFLSSSHSGGGSWGRN